MIWLFHINNKIKINIYKLRHFVLSNLLLQDFFFNFFFYVLFFFNFFLFLRFSNFNHKGYEKIGKAKKNWLFDWLHNLLCYLLYKSLTYWLTHYFYRSINLSLHIFHLLSSIFLIFLKFILPASDLFCTVFEFFTLLSNLLTFFRVFI